MASMLYELISNYDSSLPASAGNVKLSCVAPLSGCHQFGDRHYGSMQGMCHRHSLCKVLKIKEIQYLGGALCAGFQQCRKGENRLCSFLAIV
jgi:hypothetical protein